MALKKVKLGDLLELCDERNSDLKYDLSDVRGISIKKVFIDTKADMEGVSLKPYVLVKPDSFAYVTVYGRKKFVLMLLTMELNTNVMLLPSLKIQITLYSK